MLSGGHRPIQVVKRCVHLNQCYAALRPFFPADVSVFPVTLFNPRTICAFLIFVFCFTSTRFWAVFVDTVHLVIPATLVPSQV